MILEASNEGPRPSPRGRRRRPPRRRPASSPAFDPRDPDVRACADVLRKKIREYNELLRKLAPPAPVAPRMPADLSRSAQAMLMACVWCADDAGEVTPTGSPRSALKTLRAITHLGRINVYRALTDLQEKGLAAVIHEGDRTRVKVDLTKLTSEHACTEPGCGSLAVTTGRWCARCKQFFGRDDRAWQIRALELHFMGLSPVRIAKRVERPLFIAREEDGRDPHGGAVVPYLLGQPEAWLGREDEKKLWAGHLRDAHRGAAMSEDDLLTRGP